MSSPSSSILIASTFKFLPVVPACSPSFTHSCQPSFSTCALYFIDAPSGAYLNLIFIASVFNPFPPIPEVSPSL